MHNPAVTSTSPNPRLLAIGDSWASLGRLDAGLKRGSGLEAGSLGFPGKTAGQVARALRDFPNLPDADTVILLVGINDTTNHVGARTYRRGVDQLRKILARPGRRVLLVETPAILGKPQTIRSRLKQWVLRQIIDFGRTDISHYREAVRYDIPLVPFLWEPDAIFTPDGYHLTDAAFDALGEYLGRQVAIRP